MSAQGKVRWQLRDATGDPCQPECCPGDRPATCRAEGPEPPLVGGLPGSRQVADGRIIGAGYSGQGYISCTRSGWGPQREVTFQPVEFPGSTPNPRSPPPGPSSPRPPAAGRGCQPRPVAGRPTCCGVAPTVWTTLVLPVGTDGQPGGMTGEASTETAPRSPSAAKPPVTLRYGSGAAQRASSLAPEAGIGSAPGKRSLTGSAL